MSESLKVSIYGATSAIAQAVARRYAARGARFFLAGRSPEHLERVAGDLAVRGAAAVATHAGDLAEAAGDAALQAAEAAAHGVPDVLLVAFGTLGEQQRDEQDPARAAATLETNLVAPVRLLLPAAAAMERRGSGRLVVISSVAGERGRRSNHLYGAAKGGLSIFLAGLRDRLAPAGVAVVDVRPGFVDTPMTRDFRKGPLWASPERVADDIVAAADAGRAVVYTPWFWRWIMLVIRNLPAAVMRRLNL
ncbi:Short-chain dehydrogenase [Tistlia consotensis]|uniref:Short-chain dehydrogenase n=1 Tax=Tistlia consotensis USBA 355 TaxID=560819 RepID=A0A1Y6BRQ8_9PROT|nr:SDR family oxidoreductase [Tistlia consotensis]SMF22084.1 Short-chain dehydrogenase [Tistlia consotensis USBA 355]SNR46322.1 Short-chain dehydrogenase [Tistlia consotensis]